MGAKFQKYSKWWSRLKKSGESKNKYPRKKIIRELNNENKSCKLNEPILEILTGKITKKCITFRKR